MPGVEGRHGDGVAPADFLEHRFRVCQKPIAGTKDKVLVVAKRESFLSTPIPKRKIDE
jgi:hypothetical protein